MCGDSSPLLFRIVLYQVQPKWGSTRETLHHPGSCLDGGFHWSDPRRTWANFSPDSGSSDSQAACPTASPIDMRRDSKFVNRHFSLKKRRQRRDEADTEQAQNFPPRQWCGPPSNTTGDDLELTLGRVGRCLVVNESSRERRCRSFHGDSPFDRERHLT
jgi:hypothetical protein